MAEVLNVVALVKIKPEHIKDVEPLVKALAEKSRAEEGISRYDIFRVKEKEGVFVFLEQYKSEEAIKAHQETEHFKTTIAACKEFFVEPPVIVSLEK